MIVSWVSLLLLGIGVLLACTAVAALFWAARNGQFRNYEKGATVIFGDDEPIGQPTDMVFAPKVRKPKVNKKS